MNNNAGVAGGAAPTADTTIAQDLIACLDSPAALDQSEAGRRLASQDVYRAGELALAVAKPTSTKQLCALMKTASKHQLSVYIRGAGMSYSDAFQPERPDALIIEMTAMDKIREINANDLYATVEAGCTWDALNQALAPHGVRSIFWGPMSGKLSTVAGAMTQGSLTFGSGRNGPASTAALGIEAVTANGDLLVTGSAGQPGHSAFFREYGPDLTGLLCNDAGAFGIKTAVTLRLEPLPAEGQGLSFSFTSFENVVEAIRRVSRFKLATEIFGAETALVKRVAGPPDLKSDLGQLATLFRAAENPLKGIKSIMNVAINGRRFMNESQFLANFLTEGADNAELKLMARRIRQEIGDLGVETANTVAEFTRAVPFPDPMVVGPQNFRLLPLHGVVPYSGAVALHEAYNSYLKSIAERCESHGVEVYIVYTVSGPAGFLYECVIYWPDELAELHRSVTDDQILSSTPKAEPNPEGRALVEEIRLATIELFHEHGCIHFQIGRAYPFVRGRNGAALKLLKDLRSSVDPKGTINPKALGL
ncbi:MAG: FAD-binding oxidoreductase [Lysobacterales bacterium]